MAERAVPVDIQRETVHTNLGVAYTDKIETLSRTSAQTENTLILHAHTHTHTYLNTFHNKNKRKEIQATQVSSMQSRVVHQQGSGGHMVESRFDILKCFCEVTR